MKRSVTWIAFCLMLATPLLGQQRLLHIGDSLYVYMSRYPVKYKLPQVSNISTWVEGSGLSMLTYVPGQNPRFPSFLVSRGVPFGVLQGKSPEAYYLFDSDGNGVLDYQTDQPLLPVWLVTHFSSGTIDPTSDQFKGILDRFMHAFQSDAGLADSPQSAQAFQLLLRSATDTTVPNRDLMYQLSYYIEFTDRDPSQALLAVNTLEQFYSRRFRATHPIFALYKLESCVQLNDRSDAREHLKVLLNLSPDFIPGQYYSSILDPDSARGVARLTELKRSHPNHWLLKSLSE